MYYMAGGILLGMERYQDAIPHLEKAASSCAKLDALELSSRKMLVECYCQYIPLPSSVVLSETDDSKMLDTLFHSGLPLSALRPVLDTYFKARKSDGLKWNLDDKVCQTNL
jgi:hypothetical protein